ncbi:YbaB/EbfC family nucleoid-associated protein [Nocardia sp. NBC_00511]|uniref:YbaB/EbfC family nucleoid-associated protein n=1 Tax=Nocardia sp. NBC_00511 TaxID=2903591 RepID=UPI0030DE841B
MTNEFAQADLNSILEGFADQMQTISRLQHERAALTASATVRGKRVTVTVNADGTVIETRFRSGIEDLDYPEIAKAVTEAAQQAAAEVARLSSELMAPVSQNRKRLPKLNDLIPGMPDLSKELVAPPPPVVSLAPPGAAERGEVRKDSGSSEVSPRGGALDSGW